MEYVHFSGLDTDIKKQYDAKLVGILNKFMSICEENNIRWYLAYGSCIGAIRHKGIIPWDEDIDICMPRPDYDRFVNLCHKIDMGDYELCIINETPGFFEHIVRMADKSSSVLFSIDRPYVSGIYIDLFPIDGAGDGHIEKNYNRFRRWQVVSHFSRSYFCKSQYIKWIKKGKILELLLAVSTSVFRVFFQRISLNKIERIIRKYSFDESEYVVFYEGRVYGMKNVIKKEWIQDTIFVPFENVQARIPKYYHEYLTQLYGDYMTPPPVEKRDDRHVIDFLDLNRRVSIEEVKEKLYKANK